MLTTDGTDDADDADGEKRTTASRAFGCRRLADTLHTAGTRGQGNDFLIRAIREIRGESCMDRALIRSDG